MPLAGDKFCPFFTYKSSNLDLPSRPNFQADFSYDFASGDPFHVYFENQSSDTAVKFFWYFGDGSTSDSENPVHTYYPEDIGEDDGAGDYAYTVILVIEDEAGCQNYVEKYIVLDDENIGPEDSDDGSGQGDDPALRDPAFVEASFYQKVSWGNSFYTLSDGSKASYQIGGGGVYLFGDTEKTRDYCYEQGYFDSIPMIVKKDGEGAIWTVSSLDTFWVGPGWRNDASAVSFHWGDYVITDDYVGYAESPDPYPFGTPDSVAGETGTFRYLEPFLYDENGAVILDYWHTGQCLATDFAKYEATTEQPEVYEEAGVMIIRGHTGLGLTGTVPEINSFVYFNGHGGVPPYTYTYQEIDRAGVVYDCRIVFGISDEENPGCFIYAYLAQNGSYVSGLLTATDAEGKTGVLYFKLISSW